MPHQPGPHQALATRSEQDSLGGRELPVSSRRGISTQRAVENLPISGRPVGGFRSLAKEALANKLSIPELVLRRGLLDADHLARLISPAHLAGATAASGTITDEESR